MAHPQKHVGPKSDKHWRKAIMLAVNRLAKDGKTKHLDIIATRLVLKAAEGDVMAMKEIGDRLDGKPSQSLAVGQDPDLQPIQHDIRPQLSRAEWLKLHKPE
jgi:hypothetical protein